MLRVVLTLDCDRCRQSYEIAAVSTDPEPFFWESFAEDLKSHAGGDGWETDGNEIICSDCLESEQKELDECPVEVIAGSG